MKISIKLKSIGFLTVLLILVVSLLSLLVLNGINQNQKKNYEIYLMQQTKTVNTYIKQMNIISNFDKDLQALVSIIKSINKMDIAIYDMEGTPVFNSTLYRDTDTSKDLIEYALGGKIAYSVEEEYVNYMAPIYNEDQIGVVNFHYSLSEETYFYNVICVLFIKTGIIVSILGFLFAYINSNKLTQSILSLKSNTSKIKCGDYDSLTKINRNDEIGELSHDIYDMGKEIQTNILNMESKEKNLNLAVEKLKVLEKQQSNFIGNITHEFKTPLTVIKTYMDLLDMYSDDPKLLNDAKINIKRETQKLYEMVEKTLYLQSTQKYDFEINNQIINISEVLLEIASRMEGKAKKFDIEIINNLKDSFIKGDKENLSYIFINIIDNAIKYNIPKGYIFIKNHEEDGNAVIEISDTGIGISEKDKLKIFEPFYTVDKARSKKHGGTGLGLSIVKELVEKQNGEIVILENTEKMTVFRIIFPLADKNLQFRNN